MSKIIASSAIKGAHAVYERVEKKYNEALKKYGADKEVKFPNTGYFLPVIYGFLGIPVKTLRVFPTAWTQTRTRLLRLLRSLPGHGSPRVFRLSSPSPLGKKNPLSLSRCG